MRGVGPGTVLGGRYTVRRRLEQLHGTERWSADDTTLGRTVSMLCIAGDDHRTPALLDAARRAASVTHVVFVRILDVGGDDEVAYVVEEDLGEARTLAELVTDGGVPGDEVRRITGEVAAALESAGQRGMHHLDLKPDDVLRTPDGDVRLRGLETAAVRAGEDGAESDDAARRDAVGVVALTYAGLTGLWPLGAGGSGLAGAPRVPGGVAAPSEIAAGVPRDLDAICRLTLNDDQGPTSPGDFARQVAPWPSRQVVGRPVTRTASAAVDDDETTTSDAVDAGAGGAALPAGRCGRLGNRGRRHRRARHPRTARRPRRAATAVDEATEESTATRPRKRPLGRKARGRPRRSPAAPRPQPARPRHPAVQPRRRPAGAGAPVDEADEATRVIPVVDQEPDWLQRHHRRVARARPGPTSPRRTAATTRRRRARATRRSAPLRVPGAVAGALGSVGEKVGSLARRAVDKVSELSTDDAPRHRRRPRGARSPGAGRAAHQGRVEAGPGHRRRLRRGRDGHRHLGRLADRLRERLDLR